MSEKMEIETNNVAESKTFQERLNDMPAYTMSLSQLQYLYTTLKERNEVLKNAFEAGESYVNQVVNAAKPVVFAATTSAFAVAKPVVGEVKDPVAAIDNCASEALAKVQEKLPFVKQTPTEIAGSAKVAAQEKANSLLEKLQASATTQKVTKHADNVVSFSELMVELCFPTDGSNQDDLQEIEKAEEDEDKGVLVRAGNLKNRALRRGKKKMLTYAPVQSTVDAVQYAQDQMNEVTAKLTQGTNYIAMQSAAAKETIINNYPEIKNTVQTKITEANELLVKKWDNVYKTTMYIPAKALQVTGEVYVSAQEIVFAYTQAHSITEVPHAIAEMAEKYYSNLSKEIPSKDQLKEKAFAFVYVPAQVVSEYLGKSRAVQWIIPKTIEMESLQVVETQVEETEL